MGLTNPPPPGDFGPEKVRFAAFSQIFYSMLDVLELCQFVWGPAWTFYGPAETVEMVKAVTGWDVTLDELMKLGERRINMMRAFNAREGFTVNKIYYRKNSLFPWWELDPRLALQWIEKILRQHWASITCMAWTKNGNPAPLETAELGLDWAIQ